MSRPLLFRHEASLGHDTGPDHPERAARIEAVEGALAARDWLGWEVRAAPAAAPEALAAVHAPAYLERIRRLAEQGGGEAGPETPVSPGSWAAAERAAGGACALAEALLDGEAQTGFSLARPPGHHAGHEQAMGFCLLNNVAVAAQHALDRLGAKRVFILDWDVHHGNGTNDIFRRTNEVLFASIHEEGRFPGTGKLYDAGSGPGQGHSINLPVPPRADEEVWLSLLEHVVVPAAVSYRPDLVLISAGFDAHRDDAQAEGRLDEAAFAEMARHVRALAARCGAPVGAVLEGGYAPEALAASVVATMEALADDREPDWIAPEPIHTARAAAHVGHFWELASL